MMRTASAALRCFADTVCRGMCSSISRGCSKRATRIYGCESIHAQDAAAMRLRAKRGIAGLTGTVRGDDLRARLVRGALGSAGVQAASRALALVLGIILARTLGPEGYGIYAYAFAIMSLLMVVAEAGVPTLLMREVAAAEGSGNWGLLRGALQRGVQFVGLVSLVIAASGLVVLMLFADSVAPASFHTLAVMFLLLPAAALSKTIGRALMGLHRVVTAQSLEMLLRPILVIGIIGVIFSWWPEMRSPVFAMAAQLIAVLISLTLTGIVLQISTPPQMRNTRPEFHSKVWLTNALPFVLIGGALVINNQTDIIMLGWLSTADEVGIYRVAVQGAMLVFFPLQVFQAVLAPQFSKLYANRDIMSLKSLDRRSRYAIIISTLPIFLPMILFKDWLIGFFFGAAFHLAHLPLLILSTGFFFNIMNGASGTLMQMMGNERYTARVLWITSLTNFIGNLMLIPAFGSVGAAITTGLTTFAYQAILRRKARKALEI